MSGLLHTKSIITKPLRTFDPFAKNLTRCVLQVVDDQIYKFTNLALKILFIDLNYNLIDNCGYNGCGPSTEHILKDRCRVGGKSNFISW